MRKILSLVLAVILVASLTVIAAGAAGADTATVTLYDLKGGSVTETYKVGETFTAITYLNASEINEGRIGSLKADQTYTADVLELADAYNTDAEAYNAGLVSDISGMFPVIGAGTIANAKDAGAIHYNASIASSDGFQFAADDSVMIITHYTVKAAGEAAIENKFQTLAVSDYNLTRIIDKGAIVNDKFTTSASLSAPAAAEGVTVSGTVTSFLTDDAVTVSLVQGEEVVKSVDTTDGTYAISDVAAGEYVLRFAKKDHVTRDYAITVADADVTAEAAKIHPLGDINGDGKITNMDFSRANSHARGVTLLTDYALKCADTVKNDGFVTNMDASRINSAARGVQALW